MSQPLPKPGQVPVTEALVALLRERAARGLATYGRRLETFNGRDALQDAVEEALDLAQYLLQARLEREQLEVQLAEARAELAQVQAQAAKGQQWAATLEKRLEVLLHPQEASQRAWRAAREALAGRVPVEVEAAVRDALRAALGPREGA